MVKRDVMKASVMLEHDEKYAVILAFDVKVERDAQEMADSLKVKIFTVSTKKKFHVLYSTSWIEKGNSFRFALFKEKLFCRLKTTFAFLPLLSPLLSNARQNTSSSSLFLRRTSSTTCSTASWGTWRSSSGKSEKSSSTR